jgi:hypothetical protein
MTAIMTVNVTSLSSLDKHSSHPYCLKTLYVVVYHAVVFVPTDEVKVKVKQPHYRPGQALRVQEVEAPRFLDNRHIKVVSSTHRPPLPPGNNPDTNLC